MERQNTHVVIGAALFLVLALAITLVYVSSQADSVSTTTSITNTNPTVDSIVLSTAANGGGTVYSTSLTPAAGTTIPVHISGVVGDANGEEDIASTTMTFYRSGATSAEACSVDDNDCYRVTTCVLSADTDTTKKYDCEIAVDYYADSTAAGGAFEAQNWLVYVKVTDLSAATGTSNSTNREMNTTLALTIPASIDYGSFGLGATTTNGNNQDMVITQQGNDEADVEVSGTDMSCTASTSPIPVANEKWSINDAGYAAATSLSVSSADTNLNVGYRSGAVVTKTLSWDIGIPTVGVKGTCSGTNTVTTIAH